MSLLFNEEKIKKLIEDEIIEHGSEKNAEGIKYDFRLDDRFLKSKHKKPVLLSDFGSGDTENTSIQPGETVFVRTQEILHLPDDIKAELSHKRQMAHEGIQVLGGFCVDPKYEGRLIFGLFNYGSEPFPLEAGRKLIAAQFYRLSPDEVGDFPKPDALYDFPNDLIHIARSLKTVTIQALETKIAALTTRVENLHEDIDRREKWFQKFQDGIDKLSQKISEIGQALDSERRERESGQSDLKLMVKGHEKSLEVYRKITDKHKLIINLVGWITGAVVVIFLTIIIARLFV